MELASWFGGGRWKCEKILTPMPTTLTTTVECKQWSGRLIWAKRILKKKLPKLIKRKLNIDKNFNFQTCNKIYYSYLFGNRQLLLPPSTILTFNLLWISQFRCRRHHGIQKAGALWQKIWWYTYIDTERMIDNNHSSHNVFIVCLIFSIDVSTLLKNHDMVFLNIAFHITCTSIAVYQDAI